MADLVEETQYLHPCTICYFPYWLLFLTWQVVMLMSDFVAQSLHKSRSNCHALCSVAVEPWTEYTQSIFSHWFVKCPLCSELGLSWPCSVCELFWENCTMLFKDTVTQQNTQAMINHFHHIYTEVKHWMQSSRRIWRCCDIFMPWHSPSSTKSGVLILLVLQSQLTA